MEKENNTIWYKILCNVRIRREWYTQLVILSVRVTQEKVATRPERVMHYAENGKWGGDAEYGMAGGGGGFHRRCSYAEMHRGGGGR